MIYNLSEIYEDENIEFICHQLNIPLETDDEGAWVCGENVDYLIALINTATMYIIRQLDFKDYDSYSDYISEDSGNIDMVAGQALIMLISEWYNNRDGNVYTNYNEAPNAVKQLLRSIRIYDNCGI